LDHEPSETCRSHAATIESRWSDDALSEEGHELLGKVDCVRRGQSRPLSHADIAHPLRHRRALKPIEASRNVPAAPLSLVDAAFQLGIRPVELAQAVREGKWRRSVGAAAS